MAVFTWGDSALNRKKLPYAIIDGKQRMEAIFDFFDGRIVLSKEFVYLEDPQLRLSGLGYQDLKRQYPHVAELFEEYNLVDVLDDMGEIFLPKDRLLTSAGVIPVYYWLVRACSTDEYSYLREFLVRFEDERRANRRVASQNPQGAGVDGDFLEYDQYNRSTNDARSHEGRFDILLRRLRANKPTKGTPGRSA